MKNKKLLSGILASVMALSVGVMPAITSTGMLTVSAADTSVKEKVYDGEVKIWGEIQGEVEKGGEVTLDLYADTNGSTILGFEVRAMFDKSKFDLTSKDNYSLKQGAGFSAKATINADEFVYVFATSTAGGIKNDSSAPFATLKLKLSDTVVAGEKIEINFEGSNGAESPTVLKSTSKGNQVYLKPVVTPSVIKVGGFLPGDTNLNGKYDLNDVVLIAKSLLSYKLSEIQKTVGDYDQNGVVDLLDAINVAKELVK